MSNLSWRCSCGHRLIEHTVRKITGKADADIGVCRIDGCLCQKFVSADGSYERRGAQLGG